MNVINIVWKIILERAGKTCTFATVSTQTR